MNDKPIYMSRSFWGLIIAVFASVLPLFGVDWSQEDSETGLELIMAVVGGLGGLIGLIGVIKRKTTISLKGNSTKTLAGVVLVLIVPLALAGCSGDHGSAKGQDLRVRNQQRLSQSGPGVPGPPGIGSAKRIGPGFGKTSARSWSR